MSARRIALLLPLAAVLSATPAQATTTACHDLTHHGYFATGIHETGLGCHTARQVVAHVIDDGTSGLHHLHCSRSYLPHNVTEWTCSGLVHGQKVGVKFGVRPHV